jgi:hypothetical protein
VPIADIPDPSEKGLNATRANVAKKEKPNLQDEFFIVPG